MLARCVVVAALLSTSVLGGAIGGPRSVEALEPAARREVEEIVREYILKNPEIIVEAVRGLQARQEAEAQERARQAVAAKQEALLRDPGSPASGNPAGDVTVVEFFDYGCGYCRAAAPTVKQLLAEDRKVRVVYKEFPILGPESVVAAEAALAARAQGKYTEFHEALMKAPGPLSWGAIARIATGVGLDVNRLQRDMKAPEVSATIERNRALAHDLGITGTPAFVVGTELVPGAIDKGRLQELVARARQR
jgi:protein-disulfide isomerase